MDFPNEAYVRIYPRVTPTAKMYGFFGRRLLHALIENANRAGVISLPPGDLFRAVAAMIDCPDVDWVAQHLPVLTEGADPPVVVEGTYLVLPRYRAAQYSTTTPACTSRMSRRKKADFKEAAELGLIEPDVADRRSA